MMTNIVDCDFDTLKIGQEVKVVFKPTDGGPPLPMFTPAGAHAVQSSKTVTLNEREGSFASLRMTASLLI